MFEISVHIATEYKRPSTMRFRTSGLYICFHMLEIFGSQDMKMLLSTYNTYIPIKKSLKIPTGLSEAVN